MGMPVTGWDRTFSRRGALADVVNLGYVVNVIEDPAERVVVLAAAWELASILFTLSLNDRLGIHRPAWSTSRP